MRITVKKYLNKIELTPQVKIVGSQEYIHNIEIIRQKCGNGYIVSLLYDMNAPIKEEGIICNIDLWEKGNIYDIREKKYLGLSNHIENILIKKGYAKVFAILPCKIEKISINMKKDNYKQGDKVEGEIKVNFSNNSGLTNTVCNIKIRNPEKKELSYYCQNIKIENGIGKFSFYLAENDKKGKWKIYAKEVISNKESMKIFYVR